MRQLLIDGFNDLHGVCGSTATFGSSTVNCLTDEETIFEDLELGGISEEIDGALQLLKDDFTVIPDAGDKFTFDGKQFRVARVQTDFADPILTVAYTFLQDIATNSKQGTASITIGASATATHEENTTTNATGSAGITISSSATSSTHTVNSASASAAIALSAVAYATLQSVTSSSGSAAIAISATGTATTHNETSATGSAAIAISASSVATTTSTTSASGSAAITIGATGSATTTSTTSATASAGIAISATGSATTHNETSATGSAAIEISASATSTTTTVHSESASVEITLSSSGSATVTSPDYEQEVSEITSLKGWFDANKPNGTDQSGFSNGDSVSTWTSRVGTSVTLAQSTASAKPTWNTSQINSLPAIDFAVGDWLYSTSSDIKDIVHGQNSIAITTYVVMQVDNYPSSSASGDAMVLGWEDTSTTVGSQDVFHLPRIERGTGYLQLLERAGGTGLTNLAGYEYQTALGTGSYKYFGCIAGATSITLRVGGSERTMSNYLGGTWNTAQTHDAHQLQVGGFSNAGGSQLLLDGKIAEILIFNSTLGSTDIASVENYITDKYNL